MSKPAAIHARPADGTEFTLCGLAYDVAAIEPDVPNPVFANIGQTVTCDKCIEIIRYCKSFTSLRQVAR